MGGRLINRSQAFALLADATEAERLRFWRKVRVTASDTECWFWGGAPNAEGYGEWGYRRGTVLAHRVAVVFSGRDIPTGLLACHSCDNPMCCNPKHLHVGTHSDNMLEQRMRGRNHYQSKTHCKRGHEFTEENTYRPRKVLPANGSARICRACARDFNLRNWRKYRYRTAA